MAKSEEAKARKMGAAKGEESKVPGEGVWGGTNTKIMVVGKVKLDGTWSGRAWWRDRRDR